MSKKKDTPKVGEIWNANRSSRLKNVAGQGWKVSARVTAVNTLMVELTLLDGFTINAKSEILVSRAKFRKQGWVRAATFTPEQAFKLSEIVNAQHRAHEAMSKRNPIEHVTVCVREETSEEQAREFAVLSGCESRKGGWRFRNRLACSCEDEYRDKRKLHHIFFSAGV